MNEKQPNNFENKRERISTSEEIQVIFTELLKGKECETVRKKEDEKGLYLWEIRISEEKGCYAEYSYMRKGRYPEGEASESVIHIVFFDENGVPTGGYDVANLVNGKWEVTP